ncbi:MAG: flagellar basal body-associated FliL family protein [Candidatus Riflebacteria bacterium]|nr:flagellar basal body-associated FliL family protein [Candidatus Riflebacteria bacterium]
MKKHYFVLFVFCLLTIIHSASGQIKPAGDLSVQPATGQSSLQATGSNELKFNLGEFVAATRDKDPHYIKAEITIECEGSSDEPLIRSKEKMRDAVNTILMKLTIARAKDDYIDHFLHKEIEKVLKGMLSESAPGLIKIRSVYIPVFLVN